jgi:hypothetical protein
MMNPPPILRKRTQVLIRARDVACNKSYNVENGSVIPLKSFVRKEERHCRIVFRGSEEIPILDDFTVKDV